MTREEAVALLERYSNYDGMGIPNLAGCKEAMKVAVESLKEVYPELRESEDERIRQGLIRLMTVAGEAYLVSSTGIKKETYLAYLEKQKETHYTKRNALFDKCVAECDPEIMQRVSDEIDEMLEKEQKPNSTEDMPYITDEHFYEREPKDSFKYKLAEYMTRCCTKKEGPYGYEYGISAETILKMAEEELLKRGVLQKPAEWSEEDEKFLEHCSDILDGCGEPMCALRLKSLRPSWKPSEEQMKQLHYALTPGSAFDCDILNELYRQLKKLM